MTEDESRKLLEIIDDIDHTIDTFEEHIKSNRKPTNYGDIFKRFIQFIAKNIANLIRRVIR